MGARRGETQIERTAAEAVGGGVVLADIDHDIEGFADGGVGGPNQGHEHGRGAERTHGHTIAGDGIGAITDVVKGANLEVVSAAEGKAKAAHGAVRRGGIRPSGDGSREATDLCLPSDQPVGESTEGYKQAVGIGDQRVVTAIAVEWCRGSPEVVVGVVLLAGLLEGGGRVDPSRDQNGAGALDPGRACLGAGGRHGCDREPGARSGIKAVNRGGPGATAGRTADGKEIAVR